MAITWPPKVTISKGDSKPDSKVNIINRTPVNADNLKSIEEVAAREQARYIEAKKKGLV